MDDKYYIFLIILFIIFYFMYNYDIHLTPKNSSPVEKIYVDTKTPKNIEMLIDLKKNGVITKIIKVLENIPTDLTQSQMLFIVNTHNNEYQNTKNIKKYNESLNKYNDNTMMQTKYSKLVNNLFNKFDEEYKKLMKSTKKVSFNNV
jgi:hypothetical protein